MLVTFAQDYRIDDFDLRLVYASIAKNSPSIWVQLDTDAKNGNGEQPWNSNSVKNWHCLPVK
jgi:hypothetical protein